MEDKGRDLDTDQEKQTPLGERRHNPGQLTVMVMRSVGKIRSFKISRRLILWTSLFFLAFILVALYAINSFFDLGYRYRIQTERLEMIERELRKTERQLLQTRQHVAILEDYIEGEQDRRVMKVAALENKKEREDLVGRIAEEVYKKSEGEDRVSDVAIEDLDIRKEGSGISLDFRLVNKRHGDEAMEGFIHIIAMDSESNNPEGWNNPNDRLKDGLPVNFRRGQPFLIQRFKPYHRNFNLNSESRLPEAIRIIVYDRSGTLLLEKSFEVGDVT